MNFFTLKSTNNGKNRLPTYINSAGFIKGRFVKELKNRFLCEVLIDNVLTECYVPSSCHLSNFLVLRGRPVLLLPTQTRNSRTKYALYAVPYKRNYIVLNTSMANKAIEQDIHSRRFSFLGQRSEIIKEHKVDGYKADLYIKDTDTIVEIKGAISLTPTAVFPTVYSERAINQLHMLRQLLEKGKRVCFMIVSLHPYVTEIVIDRNTFFYKELSSCVELGMVLHGFTCRLRDQAIVIDKQIPVS